MGTLAPETAREASFDSSFAGYDADSLRCEGLTARIGGVTAVDDVSLAVECGQVLGLIGPNGAGKTTLLNLLSGFLRPTSGRAFLGDRDITTERPDTVARSGLVRTFQGVRLFDDLTVFENVEVAALSTMARRSAARDLAELALDTVGLTQSAGALASTLSYGAQRQVAIARAIAMRPRFLLLDEPAAGLNEDESQALSLTIRKLKDETSIGVLLVEHDMQVVMGVSDRIHVLDSGRTISEGAPEAVRADPRVIAAYLGVEQLA